MGGKKVVIAHKDGLSHHHPFRTVLRWSRVA
jgi:hypothetical protein